MTAAELEPLRKYLAANYPEQQTKSTSEWAMAALERMDIDLGVASHELEKRGRTIAAQLAAGGRIFSDLLAFHAEELTQRDAKIAELVAVNDRLQEICAGAYQLAGLVGAPVRFLDVLSNPTEGTREQIEALLPVRDDEIGAVVKAESLRDLLKEARKALDFFKTWGESLKSVVGYNPTAESWKPTLEAIAKIDAALKPAR